MTRVSALGRRPQLSDEVAMHVRNLIMSGQLRPGEFIRLDRIADQLGVSVTPVREALHSLRSEDMVRLEPRRGYVVGEITREDIEDLFELQAQLTGELVARAARRITDDALAELRSLQAELKQVARERNAPGLVDLEYRFHRSINRAARSRKLAWMLGNVAHYLPADFYADDTSWRKAMLAAHDETLAALAARDVKAARAAMKRHVLDGRDRLLRHLESIGMWDERTD